MATQAEINAIYRELLGRSADSSGLKTFAGMKPDQIRSAIKNSSEYKNKTGSSGTQAGSASTQTNPYGSNSKTENGIVYNNSVINKASERRLPDGRVQYRQRSGMGYTWVTSSGHIAGERQVVGADDPNSGGQYVVRRGMTFETRRGYDKKYDPIGYSYYSVYGRAPTVAERHKWGDPGVRGSGKPSGRWDTKYNVVEIMRTLSTTDEGRRAGADPGYYGVAAVDPEKVPGGYKPYYDIWRRYNPNATLTNNDILLFRQAKNEGTPSVYEARFRGEVRTITDPKLTYEDGSLMEITYVDPRAARNAGEGNQLWFSGAKRGGLFYGDLGSVRINRFQQQGEVNAQGMYFGYGKGTAKKGLIGGEVGKFFTEVVSDQLKFALDPLGIYTPALYGQEYGERLQRGGAQMTGADLEDIQKTQDIGQGVVASAAAFIPGIGIFVSAGIRASTAMSRSATYGTSRSAAFADAGKGFIADAVTLGVARGFTAANNANAASGLTRLAQGAIIGTTRGATIGAMQSEGSVSRNIFTGAATGAAGGAIGSVVNSAFNSAAQAFAETGTGAAIGFSGQSAIFSGLVQGTSAAASAYVNSALRYSIDDTYRQQVKQAMAAGLIDSREDFFLRESLVPGVFGIYGGMRAAGGRSPAEGFGETLGQLFEQPKDGVFSDFDWQQPGKTPKLPSTRQVLFGSDRKFSAADAFADAGSFEGGEFKGILEAFVEGAAITLGASFAVGALDPREGPVTPGMQPFDWDRFGGGVGYGGFAGGPTYGGYIQQSYGGYIQQSYGGAGGAGPAPAGSQAMADIAASGGF